jgi:hypothetical protein
MPLKKADLETMDLADVVDAGVDRKRLITSYTGELDLIKTLVRDEAAKQLPEADSQSILLYGTQQGSVQVTFLEPSYKVKLKGGMTPAGLRAALGDDLFDLLFVEEHTGKPTKEYGEQMLSVTEEGLLDILGSNVAATTPTPRVTFSK